MTTSEKVYQLKITLKDSRPPIWRRVQVLDETSLSQLHKIIQRVMGWCDCHLHQFTIRGKNYLADNYDPYSEARDERKYKLNQFIKEELFKFSYEYDFGDGWSHQIVVEKIFPREANKAYPICTAGKRACPVEDSGGLWGFYALVEKIQDPNHPEHKDMREWLTGIGVDPDKFDPAKFDMNAVNTSLRVL